MEARFMSGVVKFLGAERCFLTAEWVLGSIPTERVLVSNSASSRIQ